MSIANNERLLTGRPFFEVFNEEELRLVAFGTESVHLKAGGVLFRVDEEADCAFLVIEGQVELLTDDSHRLAETLGPGDLVGMLALINKDQRRAATAIAAEPCYLLRIPRSVISKVLEEYPEAASRIFDLIAARVKAFTRDLGPLQSELLKNVKD